MKNLRRVLTVCTFLFVVLAVVGSVYGITVPTNLSGGNTSNSVSNAAKGVWGTVVTIVQILAVAAVVFAGVRYMFASADAKADIKKQTVILVIGAVLVFGATSVLTLVSNATNEIL